MKTYDVVGTMVETDSEVDDPHPGGYVRTSAVIELCSQFERVKHKWELREAELCAAHEKATSAWAMLCGWVALGSFFVGFAIASIFA